MIKRLLYRAMDCANSVRTSIQNYLDNSVPEEQDKGAEETLVAALGANIQAYQALREALEKLPDHPETVTSSVDYDGLIPQVQVVFPSEWQCHCRIDAPPILKYKSGKHKAAAAHYIDAVAERVMAEVIRNMGPEFRKLRSAYIIYVSHIVCGKTSRSAYFDNDNLAIKGLLDAIIPLVCVDDAAIYCDNIYLTQADMESYVDLYVVAKPRLRDWAKMHAELDFANGINEGVQ